MQSLYRISIKLLYTISKNSNVEFTVFDEGTDLFGAIVAFAVCVQAFRMSKFQKNFRILAASFGLLFIGYLIRVAAALGHHFGLRDPVPWVLFMHALTVILGYLLLVIWALKPGKHITALLLMMTLLIASVSNFGNLAFHYAAFAFLSIVTIKSWKTAKPKWVATAFALLTLANIAWMFRGVEVAFLGGHVIQLAGFIVLLVALLRVMK